MCLFKAQKVSFQRGERKIMFDKEVNISGEHKLKLV